MPKTVAAHTPTLFEVIADGLDASVDGRGWNHEHQKAMQLANAAPELLAALEGVIHHDSGVKPEWKLPESLMRQVRAAISKAKAKGGSQ